MDDTAYRRRLVETFVSRVYVHGDRMVVVFNYSGGDPPGGDEVAVTLDSSPNGSDAPPRTPQTNHLVFGDGWFGVDIAFRN